MELVIIGVVIIAVLAFVLLKKPASLDVNKDGKVDADDAKAAFDRGINAVGETLDINQDGKVDADDAKAAVKAVATTAKKAAVKAKTAARSAIKKPAAKKSAAKKPAKK